MGFRTIRFLRHLLFTLCGLLLGLLVLRINHVSPRRESSLRGLANRFLGSQEVSRCRVEIEITPELELLGRCVATLEKGVDEVRLILDRNLVVRTARIGDLPLREQPLSWWSRFDSDAPEIHRLVADGSKSGALTGEMSVEFEGSVHRFAAAKDHRPLPLIFSADRPAFPWVSPRCSDLLVRWTVPRDWQVLSSDPVETLGADAESGRCTFVTRGTLEQGGFAVIGRLTATAAESIEGLESLRLDFVHDPAIGAMAGERLLEIARAATLVMRTIPGLELLEGRILLVPGLKASRPVKLNETSWLQSEPLDESDWVRCFSVIALDGHPSALQPRFAPLPEVLALLSSKEQGLAAWRRSRQRLEEQGFASPELEGWVALARFFRTETLLEAVRAHLDSSAPAHDSSSFFAESTTRWIWGWVNQRPALDLSIEKVVFSGRLSGQIEAEVEVRLTRPPPPLPAETLEAPMQIPVLFVGRRFTRRSLIAIDSSRRQRILHREENLGEVDRIVLDPDRLLPDLRRDNNEFLHRPRIVRFAVSESGVHALLWRTSSASRASVTLLSLDKDRQKTYDFSRPVHGLRWLDHGSRLLLSMAGSSGPDSHRLLEVDVGRLHSLSGVCEPSDTGRHVLAQQELADGRIWHSCYDVVDRRETPLLNQNGRRVDWVDGAEELVVEESSPSTRIVRLDGEIRAIIPRPRSRIRFLSATPVGYSFIDDGAESARLFLVEAGSTSAEDLQEIGSQLPCIVRSSFFSQDTGYFHVIGESGSGRQVLYRIPLHKERRVLVDELPGMPLLHLRTVSGVVVVDDATAREPGGAHRLTYYPFDPSEPLNRSRSKEICAAAFLDPPPVLANAGRRLYYLKALGSAEVYGEYRSVVLCSYDFLTEVEETLPDLLAKRDR